MKKVLLSAVALMIGSFAIAQVSGDAEAPVVKSAVNLSVDPLSNAVEATQAGTENYQLVRQEGTASSVYIDQSGGGAGIGNLIYVRQSGDVNGNQALSGADNRADVAQAGSENDAFVRQEGDSNDAGLVQDASVSSSIGYIRQGTGQNAEDNYAGIVQENGSGNSAWIQQTYDDNEALTLQDGSNHQSLTKQNANPNNSAGHNARVDQNGAGQMSYVDQEGSNSDADVLQNGSNNYSDVRQRDGGSTLATNEADVIQDGNLNKSFIDQSDKKNQSLVNQLGNRNKADVIQSGVGQNNGTVQQNGNRNYGKQTQTNSVGGGDNNALINQGDRTNAVGLSTNFGLYLDTNGVLDTTAPGPIVDGSNDNVAFQTQNGKGNTAESHQFAESNAPYSGYTKQIQNGDDNQAMVVQNFFHDASGPADHNNAALQVQSNNDNIAGLIQVGQGHDAWSIQDGDDSSLAVQKGKRNDLVTKQWEGANFMEIGQEGIENNIYATQRNGQSLVASQTGGTGNVMEILQVGPAGDMFETIDCNIPAEMAPMALPSMENLNIPGIDVPELCSGC